MDVIDERIILAVSQSLLRVIYASGLVKVADLN